MASGADWGSGIGTVGGGAIGGVFGGPMGAAVGAGLGGGIGGLIGGSFDEEEQGPPPVYVDPALYTTPGYDQYLQGVGQQQDYFGGRAAPAMDWSMANQDRAYGLEARGIQGEAAQSYRDVLAGKTPSLADLQMRQGLAQASTQAAQQAASTRGGGGAALLANQEALRVGAANAAQASTQAAMLRAQEVAAARAGLLQSGTQMRGQDNDMRGQSQGQTQMVAANEAQQRAQNDAMIRSLEQGRLAALAGQQGAKSQYASDVIAGQSGNQGASLQMQQMAQQQRNRDQDYQRQLAGGMLQQGGSLAAMGMTQGTGGGGGAPSQDEWDSAWSQGGGKKWW